MTVGTLYKAISDDTRLRILALLSLGSFNVQELTLILNATQSNVSHHLKKLLDAGLIHFRKEGTWAYYGLADDDPNSLQYQVTQNFLQVKDHPEAFGESLTEPMSSAKKILEKRRDETRRYFDSVATEWESIREESGGYSHAIESLCSLLPEEGVLLELGCGSGSVLKQLLPRRGSTIGVDYSPAMLDEAKKALSPFNVDLRLGYLEHLPIPDKSVDYAISHMVFHHIAHPPDALRDIFRVLTLGGKLLIVDLVSHANEYM
ncbi:MAG: metalloregulator ArsR/SmtB family transcription factor, partial [Bdellovibrionales bacterium]|nr:metalloregulator ArsR/SmtB family transcription factor [Bdellovibrionales bacterium]